MSKQCEQNEVPFKVREWVKDPTIPTQSISLDEDVELFLRESRFSQHLKNLMDAQLRDNEISLPPHEKEALDIICHLLAKITGGSKHAWGDVMIYASHVIEVNNKSES